MKIHGFPNFVNRNLKRNQKISVNGGGMWRGGRCSRFAGESRISEEEIHCFGGGCAGGPVHEMRHSPSGDRPRWTVCVWTGMSSEVRYSCRTAVGVWWTGMSTLRGLFGGATFLSHGGQRVVDRNVHPPGSLRRCDIPVARRSACGGQECPPSELFGGATFLSHGGLRVVDRNVHPPGNGMVTG